jgi:uncharacterized protein (TIGR02118 family)
VIKLIALIKRREDFTLEEFREYYEQKHVPLFARSIPPEVADAIIYYVQNHAVRLGQSSPNPPFDVVTEFGFEDVEGMRKWTDWYLGPEGQVLRDDEKNFMHISRREVVVTEERRLPHR